MQSRFHATDIRVPAGIPGTDDVPAVTMDALTMTLLISVVLYIICFVLAKRKLAILNRFRPEWSIQRSLLLSVLILSIVRMLTILGMAAMNIVYIRNHYKISPQENTDEGQVGEKQELFYDKVMIVLFDLPSCLVITIYTLLTLAWAECFVKARLRTENTAALKKAWILYFALFNLTVFSLQLALYGSLFFRPIRRKMVGGIIFASISGINFAVVILVFIFYVCHNIRFSGFPYRSQRIRGSLARVGNVMTAWTLSRLAWGITALLVFAYEIELLHDSNTPPWSFLVLLLMFFACEILPIIIMLDYSYLSLVGLERVEIRWEDEEDGSLATQASPPMSNLAAPSRSVMWNDDVATEPLLSQEEVSAEGN